MFLLNLLPTLTQKKKKFLKKKFFLFSTSPIKEANSLKGVTFFFLRKEQIYTKLKYSRCPQYDIVSGGIAALFSAFLGFLISERFGLELLDSGDFYFGFMYGVFLVFTVRPLVRILTAESLSASPFSLTLPLVYYRTIVLIFIKTFFNFFQFFFTLHYLRS